MVVGQRTGNLGAVIRAGHFEVISGVLPAKGGDDEGPDPHELLETALAACTIITVQMYANRKQWPLSSVHCSIKIDKEGPEGTFITREISFEGDLTDEQRARLFDISEKCPIHKLLTGKVEITSKMGERGASQSQR